MLHQLIQRELVIDLTTGDFLINRISGSPGDQRQIIGPVDYGWMKFQQGLKTVVERGRKIQSYQESQPPDVLTWGGGPLAGSRIPGTRRLVFCAYSPLWEGFFISSLGGAAYIMHRIGVDFVSIHGRAPQDSVLILNHKLGQIQVRMEPVQADVIWSGYADPDGNHLFGYYALQQAVFDRYAAEYQNDWLRVFAVGPASRTTNQGIIGSNQVKKGRISPIDDWAGRGGLGSRLLQHHRIAACIFGGDWEDPDLKDSKEIDTYFQQYYGDSMIRVDLGAAEKYRYVPGFMTGGTFGVNMHTVDDKLFSFNYQSIYATDSERLEQHSHFIIDHYLKQFNEEIIAPKNFAHCGEPCSIVCKKYDRIYKKDYEPYQALGPLCGIFDQRAAEQLNHFVDALGIDAIQIGSTVSWFMELVSKSLIDPHRFGLPPATEINFSFANLPDTFDIVADSARNASYAMKVISMMVFEPAGELFHMNIRQAAHALDQLFPDSPTPPSSSAVYLSHGTNGAMTPNQYWVPGMLAPMPMMGKYFVYYGLDYQSPRTLGRKCVERMVFELFSENTGVCRFHRKWVEAIVDEIIASHYKIEIDYKAHQFELAQQIYDLDGSGVRFWESERTIDIIHQYLEKWERFGLDDESLHQWVKLFRQDKWTAARAYWQEIRSGIAEAFAAGSTAIPDTVAPFQAASLDVMVKK
jgi:glyceraldehyde-3-phosphate dehydrogenase (ferredoxin)